MIATTGDFGSFRFSAEELRPAERLPFYRAFMDRTMETADIDATSDRFSFDASVCRLPALDVVHAAVSATRVHRRRELASGREKLYLMRLQQGAATIAQLGKEATISAGGSLMFSGAAPLRIERTPSRFLLIGIPRAVLEPMIADPGSALMSVIPGTMESVRLLTGYLDLAIKEPVVKTPELRRIAVHHLHDLVALTVGATREAAEIANGRGLRAFRMRAIKADIARNLEGDVTASALAARHRVSPRYIRKLFESENTSLSRYVLGQRLVRAHRMLTDARYADFTVGAIAFEAGFSDLSTFNRYFRRHFGATPSGVRAAAYDDQMRLRRPDCVPGGQLDR